jgi:hypothetical protein
MDISPTVYIKSGIYNVFCVVADISSANIEHSNDEIIDGILIHCYFYCINIAAIVPCIIFEVYDRKF